MSIDTPHSLSEYRCELTRIYGPLVSGSDLCRVLGFRSQEAFRQALKRGDMPVKTFSVDGRRGKFAMTADIAAWVWGARNALETQCSSAERRET